MFFGEKGNGPDFKEFPIDDYQQWLGGLFEVGGAIFFKKHVANRGIHQYIYYYPTIELSDNDENRVRRFQQIVGGAIYHTRKNSYRCSVKGTNAVYLAQLMARFSPSRSEIITAFENWENADTDERIAIAQEVSESDTETNLTRNDYTWLVRSAPFVAGVIDSRAVFSVNETFRPGGDKSYGWIIPRMTITTLNVPLIEALQERFGGSTEMVTHRGETHIIYGETFIVKNESIRWTIAKESYTEIISFAGSHVKLRTLVD